MRSTTISVASIAAVSLTAGLASADIVNGGFEDAPFDSVTPAVNWGKGRVAFLQDDIAGWSTNDPRSHIEIWSSEPGTPEAYEGTYYAELNTHAENTMWTTATADAGVVLDLSFAHRGRSGEDTVRVDITDLGLDGLFGTADDSFLASYTATTGNDAWSLHNVHLGLSTGNDLMVSFVSVDSAGSGSFGNFLDAVEMRQSPVIPTPGVAAIAGIAGLTAVRRRRA